MQSPAGHFYGFLCKVTFNAQVAFTAADAKDMRDTGCILQFSDLSDGARSPQADVGLPIAILL